MVFVGEMIYNEILERGALVRQRSLLTPPKTYFNMMDSSMPGNACRCPHHKMFGVFITLFGLLFVLGALNWVSRGVVDVGWPLLVLAAGLTKLFSHKCTCCAKPRAM